MRLVTRKVTPRGNDIQQYTEIDEADMPYIQDIETMVAAFEKAGFQITLLEAYNAHCAHDEDMCASWLGLPRVSQIVATYMSYLERMPVTLFSQFAITTYFSEDNQFVISREYGRHPKSNMSLDGKWILRNRVTGEFMDSDMYINDLVERNNLKINHKV